MCYHNVYVLRQTVMIKLFTEVYSLSLRIECMLKAVFTEKAHRSVYTSVIDTRLEIESKINVVTLAFEGD